MRMPKLSLSWAPVSPAIAVGLGAASTAASGGFSAASLAASEVFTHEEAALAVEEVVGLAVDALGACVGEVEPPELGVADPLGFPAEALGGD